MSDAEDTADEPVLDGEYTVKPDPAPVLPAQDKNPVSEESNEPPIKAPVSEDPVEETPVVNKPEEKAFSEDDPGQGEDETILIEELELPLSDTPMDSGVDEISEIQPITKDASGDKTTAPTEPIIDDSIGAPTQPEMAVITEQMLGGDIFFSGQSGVFYLAGTDNESFRAAALEAGYTEVYDRANVISTSARTQQTLTEAVNGRQITVSGELPEGAQLNVEPVALETASQMVTAYFGESNPSIRFAYDITILVNREKYQPADFGSSVRVTIGNVAVEDDFALLHFKSDDTVETLPVETQGDGAAFETNSFSVYMGVNKWVKLPGTIYYSGSNFYTDEACATVIKDANDAPFTDLSSIINHISGDLTIYMKSGYTVSDTQTITGGTAYTVTLKRHSSYTNSLITVATGGNLTLSNITVDGGAVWTGDVDATLGRGTTNDGVVAQAALVRASGPLTIGTGAMLQNNENTGVGNGAASSGGAITASSPIIINGGEIRNNSVGASDSSGYGGGISANGGLTLSAGLILGNSAATYGGGVFNGANTSFIMTGGEICGNSTTSANGRGGGIFVNSGSTCEISDGDICNNTASLNGGGVFLYGSATVSGGKIYENSAADCGGGLCIGDSSVVTVSGGELFENNAANGGGIYCTAKGTRSGETVSVYGLSITGGRIYRNTATANGGGVLIGNGSHPEAGDVRGTLLISGGSLFENSADSIFARNSTVAITGGSVQSVTGYSPTNGGETPASVYLNTITMNGATAKTPVTALTSTATTYGMNGVYTDADGKIYVWLPENTQTTTATVAGVSYTGSITSASAGPVAATFYKDGEAPLTGNWADEGNYDTSWYFAAPDATEYHLTTPQQLAGLAVIINGDDATNAGYYQTQPNSTTKANDTPITTANAMAGKTIYLGNDISLNTGELTRQWTPIGYYMSTQVKRPFAGIFDGAGHTISGLYCNATTVGSQGLFGNVEGTSAVHAVVKQLTVYGSVSGKNYIGGLVGFIAHATLSDCVNYASVKGDNYVAGLVGNLNGGGQVIRSANYGSIDGQICTGGIAGWYDATLIESCYNYGKITSVKSAGGIAGHTYLNGVLQNCFNSGLVSATGTTTATIAQSYPGVANNAGGITAYAGPASSITNCYNVCSITGDAAVAGIVAIGNTTAGTVTVQGCYTLGTGNVVPAGFGGTVTGCGTFAGSGGALTAGTVANCSTEQTLTYTTLLAALNGWVAANIGSNPALKYWTTDENLNDGYPVLTDAVPPVALTGNWADDGNYDTRWYYEAAVETTSFTISTPEELAGLSKIVAGTAYRTTYANGVHTVTATAISVDTFAGKTITLANNIALNNGALDANSRQWTPIGSYTSSTDNKLFSGTFEGGGYTVSGLYINANAMYQGLFGYVKGPGSILKNLTVSGSVTGQDRVGGVAGIVHEGGALLSCHNRANVTGSASNVGGVVGILYGPDSNVKNCSNAGRISGRTAVGGVAGYIIDYSTAQNCYNTGSVTGTEWVGGVVGYVGAWSTLQNSYNIGSVSGSSSVGGVAGIVAFSSVQNSYYLSTTATIAVGTNGVGAADSLGTMTSLGFFSDNGGTLTASNDTTLIYGTNLLDALNGWVVAQSGTELSGWEIIPGVNGGYPVLTGVSPNTPLTGSWANYGNYDTSWYFAAPDATEYHLSTPQQLAGLACIVTGTDSLNSGYYQTKTGSTQKIDGATLIKTFVSMAGKTIYLDNDIALNNGELGADSRQWMPIGTISKEMPGFSGIFNGQGHTVSGLYINQPTAGYLGLFGRISVTDTNSQFQFAEVKDLTVSGSVTGTQDVGGIVGHMTRGIMTNCVSNMSVNGTSYVGGLVGNLNTSGTIRSSANNGAVKGTNCTGGIAGWFDGVLIANCSNIGSVHSVYDAGGIAGHMYNSAAIENCYNAGAVTATADESVPINKYETQGAYYAGGITASMGLSDGMAYTTKISNCYNIGTITAPNDALSASGGITVSGHSQAKIEGCYNWGSGSGVTDKYQGAANGCGSFTDNNGVLTVWNAQSSVRKANLLDALNDWVTEKGGYAAWTMAAEQNGGYPIFGTPPATVPPKGVILYACNETERTTNKPHTVAIDLAELFGYSLQDKIVSVTAVAVSGVTLDPYATVRSQRRNAGCAAANTHFGVTARLNSGVETDMQGLSGSAALGTADAAASLTLKLYNYNALTQTRDAGTVTLTLSDGTNTCYVEITITRAAANISATVPLNVTAAVTAKGDFIFPDGEGYAIKNNSAFPIELTNVTWTWIGTEAAGEMAASGVFALVNNARSMTPKLGFEENQQTVSFNTGQTDFASQSILNGQMLAHNGIVPGELQLWWDIQLGADCYFYNVWDGSQPIATIIYTIAAAQNAVGTT